MDAFTNITAGKGYAAARPATLPEAGAATTGRALQGAVADFAETLQEAERTAERTLVQDADPHALVEALAQSQVAMEAAVTIRNKVVEAYREVLRMPV